MDFARLTFILFLGVVAWIGFRMVRHDGYTGAIAGTPFARCRFAGL